MTAGDARRKRALALQARILGVMPELPARPSDLYSSMRNALLSASNDGVLVTSPAEVPKLLKMSQPSEGKVAIFGGDKDQSRVKDLPRFKRSDGAWFHFTLTVASRHGQQLDLVAYDFELVFPDGSHPLFVRFDLNPPEHHNQDEGLRSHVHPGTDDFSAPSPLMSPLEILDVLLHDLCLKRKEPRT